ncbi:hypothetical protein D3C78_1620090 [compost metagenome]
MQALALGGRQQVEHRVVLWIVGGADAASRLVHHQVACRVALLQHLPVQFDSAEGADFVPAIADGLAVDPHAALKQQAADILAVEFGAFAEEAVQAHEGLVCRSGKSGGGKPLGLAIHSAK